MNDDTGRLARYWEWWNTISNSNAFIAGVWAIPVARFGFGCYAALLGSFIISTMNQIRLPRYIRLTPTHNKVMNQSRA